MIAGAVSRLLAPPPGYWCPCYRRCAAPAAGGAVAIAIVPAATGSAIIAVPAAVGAAVAAAPAATTRVADAARCYWCSHCSPNSEMNTVITICGIDCLYQRQM